MALNQERVVDPEIRSCLNQTGGTIAKGTIVKYHTTGDVGRIVKAAAATDPLLGVAMADIPDGAYGDVQVGGIGICLGGGVVAQGAQVTSDANGKGAAAAGGNSMLGLALTPATLDNFFEVDLNPIGGEAN